MNTNQLRDKLASIQKDLDSLGLEYFLVASVPNTTTGASIYNGRNNPSGAATNARTAHTTWEKAHHIDPKHDWSNKPAFESW